MINIVVVFPKIEDAKSIKNLLVRNGMNVTAVCTSGAQTMNMVDNFDYTVVICGYKLNDMLYSELYECLPPTCQMLLVASRAKLQDVIYPEILSVAMPLKVNDLVNTIDMMMQTLERKKRKQRSKPKHRTPEEQAILDSAKRLLMERNNISEEEAHRYIQKTSMDSGTNLVETAQMVLEVMH